MVVQTGCRVSLDDESMHACDLWRACVIDEYVGISIDSSVREVRPAQHLEVLRVQHGHLYAWT